MKKLLNEIGKLWRRFARFFESGDLVPFYVIISVAHYIPVLAAHDGSIIAAFVGMAVDMLHFRAVRAWFNGRLWSFHAVIGVMTTVMASAYHWRFYDGDWLLALPIPVGIAILAYQMADGDSRIAYVDRLKTERDKAILDLQAALQKVTNFESVEANLQTMIAQAKDYETVLQARDKEAEQLARELDTMKARAVKLQEYRDYWKSINPQMKAAIQYNAGEFETLKDAASKSGVSESTISRLAKSANGVEK